MTRALKGEVDLRLAGAVNLLTSFPQLASAILIARYSRSPREEAGLRRWPEKVMEAVEEVLRRAPEPLLEAVLSAVESNRWFRENYADIVYYDAAVGRVKARAAFNFLKGVDDLGAPLFRRTLCIPLPLAEELARMGGGGLDELRASDLAFKAVVEFGGDEDEPESIEREDYVCAPSWSTAAIGKLERLLPREGGDYTSLLKEVAEEGGWRGYAFLRTVFHVGAKAAVNSQRVLDSLPGVVVEVEGLLSFAGGFPAANYSEAGPVRESFRRLEEDRLKSYLRALGGGEWDYALGAYRTPRGLLAVAEALPTITASSFKGRVLVAAARGDEDLAARLAEAAGARVAGRSIGGLLEVHVDG